jgi:hypothetical protein
MTAGVLEMLDELDRGDWLTFAAQIGVASGQDYPAIFSQANEERLRQARDSIALIAAAGERPLMKLGPGQPRNILAYLVMMDIAAIFEYLVSSR